DAAGQSLPWHGGDGNKFLPLHRPGNPRVDGPTGSADHGGTGGPDRPAADPSGLHTQATAARPDPTAGQRRRGGRQAPYSAGGTEPAFRQGDSGGKDGGRCP